jgi:hypothetical protein
MTELLFGFKDLLNASNPNTPILNLSSLILTDNFVRKFNPKRYNFYIKFVNGLSDPANLYKFLYTTKDSKVYNADMKAKLENINKSLEKLSEQDKDKVVSSLKTALKPLNDNIDDRYNDLFDILKQKRIIGGNDYYIKKEPMPMKLLLSEINNAAPMLGNVPPTNIDEIIKDNNNLDKTNDQSLKTEINVPKIKGIYEKYKDIYKYSPDRLEITLIDRIIFISTTFIIRLIALALIYWGLNSNLINNFKTAYIYYSVIYILFFIFITALVNVMYYYPIFELFSNISLTNMPNLLYYFYIHFNGSYRLLLHISLILILLVIPFVLELDKKTEDKTDMNISFDFNQKEKILSSISFFSLGIFAFTSIIALKF